MDDCYQEFLDLIKGAQDAGIECVLVFKPNAVADDGTSYRIPDMIVSTSSEPDVIAALLGNYPGMIEEEAGE